MLAMIVNDGAYWRIERGPLRFIASKLAPAGKAQRRRVARRRLSLQVAGHQARDSTPSSSHTDSARWKVALAAGIPQ
ncbi:hypothetical protein CXP47_06645 [Pseudomonas chlororaphis]|nr:hypothetical protein CXP47_06645 [Pseudomonas chlororaphis]POA71265.1 hypothetical protein C1888_14395 [Pseudomonas sp. GW531-T4]